MIPVQNTAEKHSCCLASRTFRTFSDDQDFESKKFTAFSRLLAQIKDDGRSPDALIFPEDARFIIGIAPESRRLFFSDMLGDGEKMIIDSAHAINNGKIIPTASFYNTKTDTLTASEKQVLIPNGEYLPWITFLPLKIAGAGDIIRGFLETRSFEKGGSAASAQYGSLKMSALLCSEIFSPSLLRKDPFDQSDIIVNLSSHAIFHGSPLLDNQTIALAKIAPQKTAASHRRRQHDPISSH
jgi:apolipoprotein N-acyltransferase